MAAPWLAGYIPAAQSSRCSSSSHTLGRWMQVIGVSIWQYMTVSPTTKKNKSKTAVSCDIRFVASLRLSPAIPASRSRARNRRVALNGKPPQSPHPLCDGSKAALIHPNHCEILHQPCIALAKFVRPCDILGLASPRLLPRTAAGPARGIEGDARGEEGQLVPLPTG
jgi:hypothetical protein